MSYRTAVGPPTRMVELARAGRLALASAISDLSVDI